MLPFEAKVNCKYGAPMGRRSTTNELEGKVYLREVRLDSGGYDKGGAYWGSGIKLFCSWNDDDSIYFRAANREVAKYHIKANHPDAKLYR